MNRCGLVQACVCEQGGAFSQALMAGRGCRGAKSAEGHPGVFVQCADYEARGVY